MAVATNDQVQRFVDERLRVRAELFRKLYLSCKDDKAAIDDIYAALTQPTPTWVDTRPDSPPHLLTKDDVLALNTALTGLIALVEGGTTGDMTAFAGQWAIVLKACVRPSFNV